MSVIFGLMCYVVTLSAMVVIVEKVQCFDLFFVLLNYGWCFGRTCVGL